MTRPARVDYDRLASTYNERFGGRELPPRGRRLLQLASSLGLRRVLEAGCGTGYWLAALAAAGCEPVGLDLSAGMLSQARQRQAPLRLARGTALRLPFKAQSFDLVYCVDAIHHFGDARTFIAEAARVLRPGGLLAIAGNDPQADPAEWYVYDYFEGTRAADEQRFPRHADLLDWMRQAGLEAVERHEVEQIDDAYTGRAILDNPFLRQHACSQLALLSETAYRQGLARIEADLAAAEARGETLVFHARLRMHLLTGRKPG